MHYLFLKKGPAAGDQGSDVQVESAGGFRDRRKTAVTAIDPAAALCVAACGDMAVGVNIDQYIVMTGPVVFYHGL